MTVAPAVALAVLAIALLTVIQVRHVRRVGRERRDALARVQEVLSDVELRQKGIGYPTVRGRYRDRPAKVEFVVDTLTMRQLPRLWIAVTLQRPLPVRGPVDILLRPLPTDIVSPGARFRYEHPRPPWWPEHLRIATPDGAPLPPLDEVDVLGDLLADARTKDVMVAPGGVRFVAELARGDVAAYRVVRRPTFRFTLDTGQLRALLDTAWELCDELDAAVLGTA